MSGARRPSSRRAVVRAIVLVGLASFGGDAAARPARPRPPPRERADPPPAPSATTSETEARERARVRFERGVLLFEDGAWDAALVEFLASRAIYPTRAATTDAALCLRRLSRIDESLEMFETLVREFPDLRPDDRALVDREIARLKKLVGTIEIAGAEPGASITIDGRPRGSIPAPPLRVGGGVHVVRVYREGYLPFEARVEVAAESRVTVVATLKSLARSGRLHVVEGSGASVDVLVDGVVVGKTPWEGPVDAGVHSVALRADDDHGTQPAAVPVKVSETTTLTLATEALEAHLRVEPEPRGASFALDGVDLGRGIWEGALRASDHRVEVGAEGFLPKTVRVPLRSGERRTLSVVLDRDPTSPMWRDKNPPKLVFDVEGGIGVTPSFGGKIVGEKCPSPCGTDTTPGIVALANAAYQLRSGLSFGVEVGYATIGASAIGRTAPIHTSSGKDIQATLDETIRLSGPLFGAAAGYRLEVAGFPVLIRAGAGLMPGVVTDTRRGTFTASNGTLFDFEVREKPAGTYLYFAPEVRGGLRFADHFEVSLGLGALILRTVNEAHWTDARALDVGVDGTGTFGDDRVVGKTVLILLPTLGLRYDFTAPF